MRKMIKILHSDIVTGNEDSILNLVSFTIAIIMSAAWFTILMCSFGDYTHGPGSADYFLTHTSGFRLPAALLSSSAGHSTINTAISANTG